MINIKKQIQQRGYTLTQIADKMGIKQPSLSVILKKGNPQLDTLQAIAKAMIMKEFLKMTIQ